MEDPPASINISKVLLRFSEQLSDLSDRITQMETTAQRAFTANGQTSDELIMALQNFDYLNQSLDDLSRLAQLLSECHFDCDLRASMLTSICEKLHMARTKSMIMKPDYSPKDRLPDQPHDPQFF